MPHCYSLDSPSPVREGGRERERVRDKYMYMYMLN